MFLHRKNRRSNAITIFRWIEVSLGIGVALWLLHVMRLSAPVFTQILIFWHSHAF
jgi:hypothetical protein